MFFCLTYPELIRPIKRDENGIHHYTEDDIQSIEFIKCMRNACL
ncbi:MerR family transcriptional regulator [Bacillus inaquosorum]